jgi:hypothetical protein
MIYVECDYLIQTDPDKYIELTFHDFELEGCCTCDFVRLYDSDTNVDLIDKLCEVEARGQMYASTNNSMLVRFITDYSIGLRGFNATYKAGTFFLRTSADDIEVIHSHFFMTLFSVPILLEEDFDGDDF